MLPWTIQSMDGLTSRRQEGHTDPFFRWICVFFSLSFQRSIFSRCLAFCKKFVLEENLNKIVKKNPDQKTDQTTVEPRFNEPLDNGVLGITDDADQPDQSYNKMYGKTSIKRTSI